MWNRRRNKLRTKLSYLISSGTIRYQLVSSAPHDEVRTESMRQRSASVCGAARRSGAWEQRRDDADEQRVDGVACV
uniref:Uncharacterized protein n=1 Tax=Oryza brachyantha TaxID=4533 RepID=J3MQE4_ORYBR